MSTKPILFNTDMVRAILDGRKTVTRRAVKPQPLWRKPPIQQSGRPEYWANWDDEKIYKSPYRPGEILYVRETWADWHGRYAYKATSFASERYLEKNGTESVIKWRPSIHMPREAARIFLRVTDVRVERLQEMPPYDIAFEGFRKQKDFIALWNSTIKPSDRAIYGWDANPWVWVIEFERCEMLKGA